MAKVFRPPAEAGTPPDLDNFIKDKGEDAWAAYDKAEELYLDKISELARVASPRCKIAGKRVHFPVADGNAVYVVWNNTTLIWCPVGDKWQIPSAHMRGLTAADIRQMVSRADGLAKLFRTTS